MSAEPAAAPAPPPPPAVPQPRLCDHLRVLLLFVATIAGVVPFVLPYGHGCIGSNGVPQLAATGTPTLGNAAFTFTLSSAMPNTIAVFVGSLGSTNLDFGSCDLFVDLPIVILGGPITDAVGAAVQPFPIPNDPTWLGDNLFFQFAVLDPVGSVLGLFVTSNALQVQVGS